MRIPADAKIVRDHRLNLLCVVSLLSRLIEADDGLKDQVKKSLAAKDAKFGESDLAYGRLQAGAGYSFIPTAKLYALVKSGRITLDQFVSCVSVKKDALAKVLGGNEIDKLTITSEGKPSLVTELKPGRELDVERLCDLVVDAAKELSLPPSTATAAVAAREAGLMSPREVRADLERGTIFGDRPITDA